MPIPRLRFWIIVLHDKLSSHFVYENRIFVDRIEAKEIFDTIKGKAEIVECTDCEIVLTNEQHGG